MNEHDGTALELGTFPWPMWPGRQASRADCAMCRGQKCGRPELVQCAGGSQGDISMDTSKRFALKRGTTKSNEFHICFKLAILGYFAFLDPQCSL